MPGWPKRVFDGGMERADRLLKYYTVLRLNQTRLISVATRRRFNAAVGWSAGRNITLLGGGKKRSAIAVTSASTLAAPDFLHDPASDVLRAAHIMGVSAMDRYFHDKVVEKSWSLLNGRVTPRELAKFSVPLEVLRDAVNHVRRNKNARPGSQVKTALQSLLHKKTFQSTEEINSAIQMLGVSDFWNNVVSQMGASWNKKKAMDNLNAAVRRRNQIVHEADFALMTRPRDPKLRDIRSKDVRKDLRFIRDFVTACEAIL